MKRNFSNWVDTFVEYTAFMPTSPLLRRWAGISAIAGALERKVWAESMGKPLYPNMYIMLIAP